MPSIVINADDYALSPGVSSGIRQLLKAKAINATSVMANSAFWPKEAPALVPFKVDVDIGLHLCLTDLPPLTAMPTLAPEGKLPSLSVLMKKAFLRQLPLAEIKAEFIAQLRAYTQRMQSYPKHLDGHQHIHCLPGIREIVIEVYQEYFSSAHPHTYIRNCGGGSFWKLPFQAGGLKATVIHALGMSLARALKKKQIPHNTVFTGIYDFNKSNQATYAQHFQQFLHEVKQGGILMCHPGLCDEALSAQDPLTEPREAELKFFLSSAYRECLLQAGVTLSHANQPLFSQT